MNCRQAQRKITSYVNNQLQGNELEEFLLHVETCPDCYDELEIYYSIYHALNQMESEEEEGYNFRNSLDAQIARSDRLVRRRKLNRMVTVIMVLLAEVILAVSVMAKLGITIEYSVQDETEYGEEYPLGILPEQRSIQDLFITEHSEMESSKKGAENR